MHTGHTGDLAHQQALEALPWYVNGRLEPKESRVVEAHLGACESCRREADWLATLLSTHAASIPERPVDEARLGNLFAKIDRYEATRSKRSLAQRIMEWRDQLFSGWAFRPALLAGTLAAVVLAVIFVPMLRTQSPLTAPYEVMGPAADSLVVLVRFQTAQQPKAVDEFVKASRAAGKFEGEYRLARRTSTEYIVILEKKPGIEGVSRLVHTWRAAPNVAEVAIDSDPRGE